MSKGGSRGGGEYLRIAADIMLICERGCMPDKPAVARYISPLLAAVKPRGPTPSISRTCTLPGPVCVSAVPCVPYITLPCLFVPRRYLLLTKIWKSIWVSLGGTLGRD